MRAICRRTTAVGCLLWLSAAALPAAAADLPAGDKARVTEVARTVFDRFLEQVYVPSFVQLQRAEWSSAKQPYTEAMAANDRRLAYLFAGVMLVGHKATDAGVAVIRKGSTAADSSDPRRETPKRIDTGSAFAAGMLSALARRGQIDSRHGALVAEMESRFGRHPAFREGTESDKMERAGEDCSAPEPGIDNRFHIGDAEDYRRYKSAHANRNWEARQVKGDLINLVAYAPCLAHYELFELGDTRAGLATLADAIEVSGRLHVPAESTTSQAHALVDDIVEPLGGLLAYLGWLGAGMP